MTTMDARREAVVCGDDGAVLGRVWSILLIRRGRELLLDQVLVAGGAFARDTLVPFALLARSSGQRVVLSVSTGAAQAGAAREPAAGGVWLDRNDSVFAVDARLGQLRGCYVDETGAISDLLVNDEIAHQLSLVRVRAVDEIGPHRIQLGSRISEMGVLPQPAQAQFQPVESRSEAERFAHGGAVARPH